MEQQDVEWDKLENLLKRKSFQDLSIDEKSWVLNYFESEQDYEQFRLTEELFKNPNESKILYPSKHIISQLKSAIRQQRSATRTWWNFSVPAYTTATLIFVFSAFGWWVGHTKPAEIAEHVVIKSDTVFVAARPDTVFIEKIIIQKPREVFYSVTESTSVLKSITSQPNHGVSMKDNEELESLLVSGNGEGVF